MSLWLPYLLSCFYLHLTLILLPFFFSLLVYIEHCLRFNFPALDRSGTRYKPPKASLCPYAAFPFTKLLNNWTKCCACSMPVGVSKGISEAVSWRVESQELDLINVTLLCLGKGKRNNKWGFLGGGHSFLMVCIAHVICQETSLYSSQVIKHKLCRCSGRKHQHNNNDQGTVLSLDDVKCHVSNFH